MCIIYAVQTKNTTHRKVMKRIVEKSTQNVNSNPRIFSPSRFSTGCRHLPNLITTKYPAGLLPTGSIQPKIGSSTAKASRGGAETRRFDGFSDGIGIYAVDVRKDVLHQLGEG